MSYESYKTVLCERRGKVLNVTLNRPKQYNAVDAEMHEELSRLFTDISRDQEAEVVVLTGAGRAFSAGGHLGWLQDMIDRPAMWEVTSAEAKAIILSILDCRQPIIAKINGAAAGLGATIALACDITFAADSAVIGDPHVAVGFTAGDGGTALWPYLIGYARAREYLYTGELLPAHKAAEIGLINHCVAAAALDAEVDAFADKLAGGAIRAVQWTKQAVNAPLRQIVTGNMETSLALEFKSNLTEDHQEGVNALREKRKPEFKGR